VTDDHLDLVLRGRRAITAYDDVARCIGVRDGRVVAITPCAGRALSGVARQTWLPGWRLT
jgi:hypothetical protein